MTDKLLPCPFCGGEPKLDAENEPKRVGAFIGEYYVRVWHYCGNEAHMYAATSCHDSDRQTAIEKAIAAWNTRAERTCRNEDGWCSECKHFLNDGFKWCPYCGAKVVER